MWPHHIQLRGLPDYSSFEWNELERTICLTKPDGTVFAKKPCCDEVAWEQFEKDFNNATSQARFADDFLIDFSPFC